MADALQHDGIERRRPRHPRGVRRTETQMDLDFVAPVLKTPVREILGMVRTTDPIESQRAAVDSLAHRTQIQNRILAILVAEGPQTDRQLAARNEFRGYGQSTVRTRRSELTVSEKNPKGLIVKVGRLEKHSLWGLKGSLDDRVDNSPKNVDKS